MSNKRSASLIVSIGLFSHQLASVADHLKSEYLFALASATEEISVVFILFTSFSLPNLLKISFCALITISISLLHTHKIASSLTCPSSPNLLLTVHLLTPAIFANSLVLAVGFLATARATAFLFFLLSALGLFFCVRVLFVAIGFLYWINNVSNVSCLLSHYLVIY